MTQEERYAMVRKLWPDLSLDLSDIGKAIDRSPSNTAVMAYRMGLPTRRQLQMDARRKAKEPPPSPVSTYRPLAPLLGLEAVTRVMRRPSATTSYLVDVAVSLPRVRFAEHA